ncbi:hypothetical protein ABPG75_009009 [Micractinium tetrahymenae]
METNVAGQTLLVLQETGQPIPISLAPVEAMADVAEMMVQPARQPAAGLQALAAAAARPEALPGAPPQQTLSAPVQPSAPATTAQAPTPAPAPASLPEQLPAHAAAAVEQAQQAQQAQQSKPLNQGAVVGSTKAAACTEAASFKDGAASGSAEAEARRQCTSPTLVQENAHVDDADETSSSELPVMEAAGDGGSDGGGGGGGGGGGDNDMRFEDLWHEAQAAFKRVKELQQQLEFLDTLAVAVERTQRMADVLAALLPAAIPMLPAVPEVVANAESTCSTLRANKARLERALAQVEENLEGVFWAGGSCDTLTRVLDHAAGVLQQGSDVMEEHRRLFVQYHAPAQQYEAAFQRLANRRVLRTIMWR